MKDGQSWVVVVQWLLSLVGIWQFSVLQSRASRRPFLENQLEVGFQATVAPTNLAARTRLARPSGGRIGQRSGLVEDRNVENARAKLTKLVPAGPVQNPELPPSCPEAAYDRAANFRR
jgi:hypothetical protein